MLRDEISGLSLQDGNLEITTEHFLCLFVVRNLLIRWNRNFVAMLLAFSTFLKLQLKTVSKCFVNTNIITDALGGDPHSK
jgi:hypothetical protein